MTDESDPRSRVHREADELLGGSGGQEGVDSDELFPLEFLEGVAHETLDALDRLCDSMTQEELDTAPDKDNFIENIYVNDLFVRDRILPLTRDLMQRTQRIAQVGQGSIVGYLYLILDDQDEGEYTHSLVINDQDDGVFSVIESPAELQVAADSASKKGRDELKIFASSTRGDILTRFQDYVEEYA